MMWKTLQNTLNRPCSIKRFWVLSFILVVEVVYALLLWKATAPRPEMGFLIKDGPDYLVAWRLEGEQRFSIKRHETLPEAVRFLSNFLELRLGQSVLPESELEHAWMHDRSGRFVLNWKTTVYPILHHLTFSTRGEAAYFLRAFRTGAYTPSIFGHSLLLTPVGLN